MGRVFAFVLTLLLSFDFSEQFSHGGPVGTCNSLMPSHQGALPQDFPSPYEIIISENIIGNGQVLKVEIRSDEPNRTFNGFMLQARTVEESFAIDGLFISSENVFNFVNCSGARTTVTNANNLRKESITFEWSAPYSYIGKIRFHATVLETRFVFWVNQYSQEIDVIYADVPTTSPEPPTAEPELPEDDFYDGCDVTKTCFGIGDGDCVRNRRCGTIGAVIYSEERFFFEMRSSIAANYVALGLSYDRFMGTDSVIECVRQGQNVQAFTSFTNGRVESPRIDNQTIISLVESSIINGMIYCKVERLANTNIGGVNFNLIDDKHYLMLVSGTLLGTNSVGNHDIDHDTSSVPLLLTEISVVQGRSRTMLYLHASFMIVAWIMLTSIGIFTARFMKKTWIDVKIFGKDFWFMVHQVSMCLTWVLTLIGFIIILIDSNQFTANAHSILGIISFSLCMIQPFGAVFRPGPKDAARPIFNFLHSSAGNFSHLLSIITMFYAVNLTRAQLSTSFTFIMISYATVYVTFYTTMTVLGFFSAIRADNLSESTHGLTSKSNFDAPYSVVRKTLYIIFVLLAVLFAAGLITVTVSETL